MSVRSSLQSSAGISTHLQKVCLAFGLSLLFAVFTSPSVVAEVFDGRIGLGSWSTSVEFDDVRVEVDGKTVFQDEFESDAGHWQPEAGDFTWQAGVLAQRNRRSQPAMAWSKEAIRTDGKKMVLTLRARKTGGNEGFLVAFGRQDNRTFYWWNIAGWNNTAHAFGASPFGDFNGMTYHDHVRGRVDSDTYYTIRIELTDRQIAGSLNDELIQEVPVNALRIATPEQVGSLPPPASLPGRTADPHVASFDGRYYIYPTTDGTVGWAASSFSCYSSDDLIHWRNEGVILDFKDLTWATRNAWAPAIARKNGKYYFYYSAQQSIGVAVADSPVGPFKDPLGKPLVPRGAYHCQVIDPMVFIDDDGSAYLYFGQGQCNVVKLNPDMISYDPDAVKRVTPPAYNEGAFVLKRNGIYYLMWSQYDTRDPRYCVNYGTSDSPLGPFQFADNNPVIKGSGAVRGAGHHSVLQIPGQDEWYAVYHRFAIPDGNGYNRETCISPLRFDNENRMLPVHVYEPAYAYVMPYFDGGLQKLSLAYSYDARNWTALNGGRPIDNWISKETGQKVEIPFVRDPFVAQVDGKFHLVHTTAWAGTTIGHWVSDDLITWTGGPIEVVTPDKVRCWAPEFTYLPEEKTFYVYWASLLKKDGSEHNAMHYLTTRDWENITPADSAVYYDIGIHDIDLTIYRHDGTFYGFHKTGDVGDRMGNRLSTVTSLDPSQDSFTKDGHGRIVFPDETKPTEGPEVVKLVQEDKWLVYGDPFNAPLEAWETTDFQTYTKIEVTTPPGSKHCSFVVITTPQLDQLRQAYPD